MGDEENQPINFNWLNGEHALPEEIICMILILCSRESLENLRSTCRAGNTLGNDSHVLREHYRKEYRKEFGSLLPGENIDYTLVYKSIIPLINRAVTATQEKVNALPEQPEYRLNSRAADGEFIDTGCLIKEIYKSELKPNQWHLIKNHLLKKNFTTFPIIGRKFCAPNYENPDINNHEHEREYKVFQLGIQLLLQPISYGVENNTLGLVKTIVLEPAELIGYQNLFQIDYAGLFLQVNQTNDIDIEPTENPFFRTCITASIIELHEIFNNLSDTTISHLSNSLSPNFVEQTGYPTIGIYLLASAYQNYVSAVKAISNPDDSGTENELVTQFKASVDNQEISIEYLQNHASGFQEIIKLIKAEPLTVERLTDIRPRIENINNSDLKGEVNELIELIDQSMQTQARLAPGNG